MKKYIQNDCFALGNNGICLALETENCLKCNFYKSKEQVTNERLKCKARLIKLGAVDVLEKHSYKT